MSEHATDSALRDLWGSLDSGRPLTEYVNESLPPYPTRRLADCIIREKVALWVPTWLANKHGLQGGVVIGTLLRKMTKAVLVQRKTRDHWFPLSKILVLQFDGESKEASSAEAK